MQGSWCWRPTALVLTAAILGCSPDSEPTSPRGTPSFFHEGIPDINGRIFLRDGPKSLCSLFSDGTLLGVRGITVDGGLTATATVCPANDYSMPVEPGSYMVRVNLPLDQSRGDFPQRWLEPGAVNVDAEDVIKDIHVGKGSPLGGRVTLNGRPISGVSVSVSYSDFGQFVSGFGISGPTGTWQDGFFPSRWNLQEGVRYSFSGCQVQPVPGIREMRVTPAGPFLFPSESRSVDCAFLTGKALQYTHKATRLKLTSYPGDIGGFSDPVIFPDLGYGYSAQFPLPPGQSPQAGPTVSRQLFRGGVVLAVAPDLLISGAELDGYVVCAVSPCRGLGFDGQAGVTERSGGRREITWIYSDAGSLRPRGIKVLQRSFDGANGDYVLYSFRITNTGTLPVTFAPGLFLDFDVGAEFGSNTGYTELGGQLMITTTADEVGRHLGSVIIGAPRGGRSYFVNSNFNIPESEAFAGIRGEISNPSITEPSDVRAFQGGATVRLTRGKSTEFWVAVVAGDTRAQAVANARAAIAEGTARRNAANTFSSMPGSLVTPVPLDRSAIRAAGTRTAPICKAGCNVE